MWGAALIGLSLAAYFYNLEGWESWTGLPAPLVFAPSPPSLIAYGAAFAVGWLAHRQPARLLALAHRWQPFAALAELHGQLATDAGAERIDLGGGFAGSPHAYADAVRPHLPEPARLIVEPGRGIVADAGWLLTRVVRSQARGHLIADAGMTELIRPMLYGASHPVMLVTPGRSVGDGPWTLSGPICEAGDVLARDLQLGPSVGEGALLAIGEIHLAQERRSARLVRTACR